MKKAKMEWRMVRSLRGVSALARELGYSHTHILRVMDGRRRPGAELAAKLESRGITLPPMPAKKEVAE